MAADFPTSVVSKGQTGLHNTASVASSTLAGAITGTPATFEIADATGWPTTSFDVVFPATGEVVHVSSRSGTTCTVGERGHGVVASTDQANGAVVAVCFGSDHAQKLGDEVTAIQNVLKGNTPANLTLDGIFTADQFAHGAGAFSVDASGNVVGASFTGDGSGLTGIASGTGGVTNTGSTTIGADTVADGVGVIALQTRGTTRFTVGNLGGLTVEGGTGLDNPLINWQMRKGAFGNELAFQAKSAGTEARLNLFSNDGDGTDNVEWRMFGVGLPSAVTNSESLRQLYQTTGRWDIFSHASGTGTVRPLHIYTGSNTNQLVLAINGGVSVGAPVGGVAFTVQGSGALGGIELDRDAGTPANSARLYFDSSTSPSAIYNVAGAFLFATGSTPGSASGTERTRIDSSGNLGLGQTTFGTSATKVLAIGNGTAPTTSPQDAFQMWSQDTFSGAAHAGPHFRGEQGGEMSFGGTGATLFLRDVTTDVTSKNARVASGHYTNAEEPMSMILGQVSASISSVHVGGGLTGTLNAAQRIHFYTAANQTTLSNAATEVFRIDEAQRMDFRTGGAALGGGASATLGTIGGSGPTTATQAGWQAIKVNGTTAWIPYWT